MVKKSMSSSTAVVHFYEGTYDEIFLVSYVTLHRTTGSPCSGLPWPRLWRWRDAMWFWVKLDELAKLDITIRENCGNDVGAAVHADQPDWCRSECFRARKAHVCHQGAGSRKQRSSLEDLGRPRTVLVRLEDVARQKLDRYLCHVGTMHAACSSLPSNQLRGMNEIEGVDGGGNDGSN